MKQASARNWTKSPKQAKIKTWTWQELRAALSFVLAYAQCVVVQGLYLLQNDLLLWASRCFVLLWTQLTLHFISLSPLSVSSLCTRLPRCNEAGGDLCFPENWRTSSLSENGARAWGCKAVRARSWARETVVYFCWEAVSAICINHSDSLGFRSKYQISAFVVSLGQAWSSRLWQCLQQAQRMCSVLS